MESDYPRAYKVYASSDLRYTIVVVLAQLEKFCISLLLDLVTFATYNFSKMYDTYGTRYLFGETVFYHHAFNVCRDLLSIVTRENTISLFGALEWNGRL